MGRKSSAKKKKREMRASGLLPDPPVIEAKAPQTGPIHVTDHTFDRTVLDSELPVLVDFWAPWCGPCKAIAPVLDQLAEELAGEIKIVKYDTQANQRVATALNIRSVPSLVMFKDGEIKDVQIGALPPERLRAWVKKTIAPKRGLFSRLRAQA